MKYREIINLYKPKTHNQEVLKKEFIELYDEIGDSIFLRECLNHITSSTIILNKQMNKMLMIYHNIYKNYGWQGGHNDGDDDPVRVAIKEAFEETGLSNLYVNEKVYSLDILPVSKHYKNGLLVPLHNHYNLTFVFRADDNEEIIYNENESSDIRWVLLSNLADVCKEKNMLDLYKRVINEFKEENDGLFIKNEYVVKRLSNE